MLVSPVAALVALAALDLATAHGSGHFTGSILHARSAGDLRDVIVRRYSAAWGELHNHAMPVATALALLAAALGAAPARAPARARRRDPGWLAALRRRPHRGGGRRAGRGLRPGPAGRRRVRARLRGQLPVGPTVTSPARPRARRRRRTDAAQLDRRRLDRDGLGLPPPQASARAFALCHGRPYASQIAAAANSIAHSSQPSVVVPTPTYFRPEAAITNVMTGLM